MKGEKKERKKERKTQKYQVVSKEVKENENRAQHPPASPHSNLIYPNSYITSIFIIN